MSLSEPPLDEDGHELPFEWNQATYRKLQHFRIYASPGVLTAADEAYNTCWRWGHATQYGNDDDGFYDRQEAFNSAELVFYDAIRRDLGLVGVIGQDGRPAPGSGWTAPNDK